MPDWVKLEVASRLTKKNRIVYTYSYIFYHSNNVNEYDITESNSGDIIICFGSRLLQQFKNVCFDYFYFTKEVIIYAEESVSFK